jgi:ABC-type antimicrobial peptide transport system permease subunit
MRRIIVTILGAVVGTAAGFTGGFMFSFLFFGDGSKLYFLIKRLGVEPYLLGVGVCTIIGLILGGTTAWFSVKQNKTRNMP